MSKAQSSPGLGLALKFHDEKSFHRNREARNSKSTAGDLHRKGDTLKVWSRTGSGPEGVKRPYVTSLFAEKGMSLKRIFLICESFEERSEQKQHIHTKCFFWGATQQQQSREPQPGKKNNICFFEEESGCMYVRGMTKRQKHIHSPLLIFIVDRWCISLSATWISLCCFFYFFPRSEITTPWNDCSLCCWLPISLLLIAYLSTAFQFFPSRAVVYSKKQVDSKKNTGGIPYRIWFGLLDNSEKISLFSSKTNKPIEHIPR